MIDDAQALLVVVEAARHQRADDALAGMPERRVAEVVAERNRFGQLLVQPQHLGDRPRDLRDLEGVGQARAVVIAGRREEDLRLVLQPAERLAVDDAIAIALKRRADLVFRLLAQAPARIGALGRLGREDLALARFELLSRVVIRLNAKLAKAAKLDRSYSAGLACSRSSRVISRRKLVPWAIGPTPKISASVWPRSANVWRVPRSYAGAHAGSRDQQRHVLARMIGARRRRIVAVIGGDDEQIVGRGAAAARAPAARRNARGSRRSRQRHCGGRTARRSRRGW